MKNGVSISIPKNNDEFKDFLKEEWDSAVDIRDEINKHIGEVKITELRSKRSFLQNIFIGAASRT